jgi:hypothetical protein
MTILCFIGFNWHPAEGADVGNWQLDTCKILTFCFVCFDFCSEKRNNCLSNSLNLQ